MSGTGAPVDLVFLWHHHQPDYRSPREGRALLPWVRLHGTKDYLDMALRLKRHPGIRATFNFVPSLLDQIEAAGTGLGDVLFDLLRRPIAELSAAERRQVASRCLSVPRHAADRWPGHRRLRERTQRIPRANGEGDVASEGELMALEIGFLLGWVDPMFHDEPEARSALGAEGRWTEEHRQGLLNLHDRLLGQVIPAYRALLESGQIEVSISPYDHPILPLLIDVQAARRARPDLPLPAERFAAPEDAARQIALAQDRCREVMGIRPQGLWPPEGSVSPEALEVAARAGARWLASDEGVLWPSLAAEARRREALYRPWRFETPSGSVALFFRDHDLSDRIGFVYHHWRPQDAVADFLARIRRIADEHRGATPPVVAVILDGENCWEHYADDGGPFLEALYDALEQAGDIRTRTPSELIESVEDLPALPELHSGSWINADFRIWIGHPEKNRAWDLLSRTRRALAAAEPSASTPDAWQSLYAAEGSDWFWWLGDDHFTPDKAIFDRLFREHLYAVYERAGLAPPGWLQGPIARADGRRDETQPLGFLHPTLDGRRTEFYEWHAAGHHRLDTAGSAMHKTAGLARDLYYGFDPDHLYLRIDFMAAEPPGDGVDLSLEIFAPEPRQLAVRGLVAGDRAVAKVDASGEASIPEARCCIATILELAVRFDSLGLKHGDRVEMLGMLVRDGQVLESLPADDLVRFTVPDPSFESALWSA